MTHSRTDYWIECISVAAEECGAKLTIEQIEEIAYAVEGANENMSMAFPVPDSPYPGEIKRLEAALKRERDKSGCPDCHGIGRLRYNAGPWDVDTQCDKCHGEGKV